MRYLWLALVVLGACTFGRESLTADLESEYWLEGPQATTADYEVDVASYNSWTGRKLAGRASFGRWFGSAPGSSGQTDDSFALLHSEHFVMQLFFDAAMQPPSAPDTNYTVTTATRPTEPASQEMPAPADSATQVAEGHLYFCPNDLSGSVELPAVVRLENGVYSFRATGGEHEITGRIALD